MKHTLETQSFLGRSPLKTNTNQNCVHHELWKWKFEGEDLRSDSMEKMHGAKQPVFKSFVISEKKKRNLTQLHGNPVCLLVLK